MMYLTRHSTSHGACWAVDGQFLPEGLGLDTLLSLPAEAMKGDRAGLRAPGVRPLAPCCRPSNMVRRSGLLGSPIFAPAKRACRSLITADIYDKVYEADRAEVFFKAVGWRAMGTGQPIRVRKDSTWDVPETGAGGGHQSR